MKTVLRPAWTPWERNQRELLTGSKCDDQFSAFLTKKSMLIKDGRMDLNPLKKKITRSWVRKGPFFWSGTKFHFDSFFAPDSPRQLIRPRRTCGNAEVPEDYWVLRVRSVCFPTSNRLNTWPSPSGTNWSRQYHESTVVWLNLPHLFKCLPPLCHAGRPGEVPGLPIRDCARGCNNRAQICAQLNAIDVIKKIFFERFYLVLGLRTFGPWVNCPYASTTPPLHCTTISRFLSNFFPPMAPHFFWYTIHQVIWPSPGTLGRGSFNLVVESSV